MNDRKSFLGVVIMITLGISANPIIFPEQQADAISGRHPTAAPPAITGDNIYVAWWTNKTGNDEVLFRASNDKG